MYIYFLVTLKLLNNICEVGEILSCLKKRDFGGPSYFVLFCLRFDARMAGPTKRLSRAIACYFHWQWVSNAYVVNCPTLYMVGKKFTFFFLGAMCMLLMKLVGVDDNLICDFCNALNLKRLDLDFYLVSFLFDKFSLIILYLFIHVLLIDIFVVGLGFIFE